MLVGGLGPCRLELPRRLELPHLHCGRLRPPVLHEGTQLVVLLTERLDEPRRGSVLHREGAELRTRVLDGALQVVHTRELRVPQVVELEQFLIEELLAGRRVRHAGG